LNFNLNAYTVYTVCFFHFLGIPMTPEVTTQAPAKKAPAKKVPATKAAVVAKKLATPAPAKATPAKTLKPIKPTKPVKHKLVRDSFTIPKDEYLVLGELKARLTKLMQPAKKSELLRAGLKALAGMSDAAIKKALQDVPAIKTGRPAK
jgi:hypothetical protein